MSRLEFCAHSFKIFCINRYHHYIIKKLAKNCFGSRFCYNFSIVFACIRLIKHRVTFFRPKIFFASLFHLTVLFSKVVLQNGSLWWFSVFHYISNGISVSWARGQLWKKKYLAATLIVDMAKNMAVVEFNSDFIDYRLSWLH